MAYIPYVASRSHVGHGARRNDLFAMATAPVSVRALPVADMSTYLWEVLMDIAKAPGKVLSSVLAMIRRERLRAELSALDDRLLADIGIERDQIDGVVTGDIRREAGSRVTMGAEATAVANENAPQRTAA